MYDCFGYLCRRKAVRRINSLLILWAHFTTRKAGAAGGGRKLVRCPELCGCRDRSAVAGSWDMYS